MSITQGRILAAAAICTALAGCGSSTGSLDSGGTASPDVLPVAATPKAVCGPGSLPETGLQGRVSPEDHASGAAAQGFRCNMEMVGSYVTPNPTGLFPDPFGTVGGFKVERYVDADGHECAYYDTTLLFPTNLVDAMAGVNVMDMSDPTHPVVSDHLVTLAMLSPHESLVISQERGVLAAVMGNPAFAPGIVDVYDISKDCRHPQLKSSLPVGTLGHESGMAPDGLTFYSASPGTPTLTPVDITNPVLPVPLTILPIYSHGLSVSPDGNRIYVAGVGPGGGISGTREPDPRKGLMIVDTTEIQARKSRPSAPVISHLSWPAISIPQNAIPITIKGRPYLVEIDEYGGIIGTGGPNVGAGRIIDISDETKPKVISDLRLEVHQNENFDTIRNDSGATNPAGGYVGHYCNVPSRVDPPIVACSMSLSGLRVFDIRDPAHPREVAYFNAPIHPRIIATPLPPPAPSFPPQASNWAMSSPAFVPERKEIWYTDGYNGFYVVRVTNGVW